MTTNDFEMPTQQEFENCSDYSLGSDEIFVTLTIMQRLNLEAPVLRAFSSSRRFIVYGFLH